MPILIKLCGNSCSLNVTSTPVRAVWPIYNKKRGSIVEERDAPPCKSVMFAGPDKGAGVSRSYAIDVSEGVPESNIASGGFSVLESIARKQVDEGAVRSLAVTRGDGAVLIPLAEHLFGQKEKRGDRPSQYPSQSAKIFSKDYFELVHQLCSNQVIRPPVSVQIR